MNKSVHLFDGYVTTQGKVRARCSCGFLTVGQAAQRAARHQLVTSHGLSDLVCEACGRDSTNARLEVGLPSSLTIQPDPVAGHHRLVCAQGSGGCDLTSELGPQAAAQVAEATDTVVAGVREQVQEFQASTIATAIGVLMGRSGIDHRTARARLSAHATHLGVSQLEAANRVVASASGTRRPSKSPTRPTTDTNTTDTNTTDPTGIADEPQPI